MPYACTGINQRWTSSRPCLQGPWSLVGEAEKWSGNHASVQLGQWRGCVGAPGTPRLAGQQRLRRWYPSWDLSDKQGAADHRGTAWGCWKRRLEGPPTLWHPECQSGISQEHGGQHPRWEARKKDVWGEAHFFGIWETSQWSHPGAICCQESGWHRPISLGVLTNGVLLQDVPA